MTEQLESFALPSDSRFSVGREFIGDYGTPGEGLKQGQQWVVRFCGKWIDAHASTKREAIDAAWTWKLKNLP